MSIICQGAHQCPLKKWGLMSGEQRGGERVSCLNQCQELALWIYKCQQCRPEGKKSKPQTECVSSTGNSCDSTKRKQKEIRWQRSALNADEV